MRDHHHPRNLRRSFGSQPMVCVGRPSWSEAGIAALVIPAQSSRWTSRGQGDVHYRRADLLEDNHQGVGPRTHLRPQIRRFLFLQHQRRGFCLKPRFENTTVIPKPQKLSKRLLRCLCSVSFITRKAPFTNSSEKPNIASGWIRLLGIFDK
jgi:hypothetical protein